jgi:hypothetical protein
MRKLIGGSSEAKKNLRRESERRFMILRLRASLVAISAAATAAAAAAVSTAAATATAAAATATASISATAITTTFAGLGFVNGQRATVEFFLMQTGNRFTGSILFLHFDKTEALAAAGFAILNHFGATNGTELGKELL